MLTADPDALIIYVTIEKRTEGLHEYIMITMWNRTDISLGKYGRFTLGATRQGWYLDKEKKVDIKHFAELLKKALPYFDKYLDLPETVGIKLCAIKARNTSGNWFDTTKIACIDYRKSFNEMMDTIAHELVHAEQYHQGRLTNSSWMDKKWAGPMHTKSFKKYWNFPWEVEARARSAGIAFNVWCDMCEDNLVTLDAVIKNVGWKWLKDNRPELRKVADERVRFHASRQSHNDLYKTRK